MGERLQRVVLHHVGLGVVDHHVGGRRERVGELGADLHAERPHARRLAGVLAGGAPRHRADEREIGAVGDRRDERAPDPTRRCLPR